MAYRFMLGGLFSALLLVICCCPDVIIADGGIPKVKTEKQRTELRVRSGEQVRLPCPVEWTPSLILEWFKDGVAVERAMDNARPQRKSLLIVNATRDNRGVYVCRAINGFGSAEVSIRLDVERQPGDVGNDEYDEDDDSQRSRDDFSDDNAEHQPGRKPEFVELFSPSNNKNFTQSPEMSSVRFRCIVRGQPRPDVRWLKDGREMGFADRDSAPTPIRPKNGVGGSGGGATLFLKNLQQHHSGNYTCVASNDYGTINATFVLDVVSRTPRKPVLTDGHPLNTSVEFGGTASFQCRVKSDALPHIQWLKRLEDPVQMSDQYNPQTSMNHGHGHGHGHHSTHNNGTIVFEGSRFKVLKSTEVVERNEGLYLNKLLLTDVQQSDSGTYVCMAANTMGYSYKSAHLSVTSNDGPWQVMSDVYGGSSVYHHDVSVAKFPETLVIVVPLTVIGSLLLVCVVFQCRRHSIPMDNVNKTVVSTASTTVQPRQVKHSIPGANNSQKTVPLLGSTMSNSAPAVDPQQKWVDLPSQVLLQNNHSQISWHPHHYQNQPNNGPSSHQSGSGSRRSGGGGGAATPSGSQHDSCSGNSANANLPKVHHHHHYRQHHHQHVYYGQPDDWSSPFQC